MAPLEDSTEPESCVSGEEALLQDEIARLRSAVMRTVIELDRFCDTVSKARGAVKEMAALQETVPETTTHEEN
jgi:hypothetical protein